MLMWGVDADLAPFGLDTSPPSLILSTGVSTPNPSTLTETDPFLLTRMDPASAQ